MSMFRAMTHYYLLSFGFASFRECRPHPRKSFQSRCRLLFGRWIRFGWCSKIWICCSCILGQGCRHVGWRLTRPGCCHRGRVQPLPPPPPQQCRRKPRLSPRGGEAAGRLSIKGFSGERIDDENHRLRRHRGARTTRPRRHRGARTFRLRRHHGAQTRTSINSGFCNSSVLKLSSDIPRRHRGARPGSGVVAIARTTRSIRWSGRVCWQPIPLVSNTTTATTVFLLDHQRLHVHLIHTMIDWYGSAAGLHRSSTWASLATTTTIASGKLSMIICCIPLTSTTRLSRRDPVVRHPVCPEALPVRLGRHPMTVQRLIES